MELREWLIILGLALVSLIVVDGVRRLQRQRRVPRLDQAGKDLPAAKSEEFNDEVKEAEINWELPNGGARVVKPADYSNLGQKPKLERQEHPGPSKVLSDFRRSFSSSASSAKSKANAHFSWSRKNEPRKHEQPSAVGHPTSTSHASVQPDTASAEHTLSRSATPESERREPSIFMAEESPAILLIVKLSTQTLLAKRQVARLLLLPLKPIILIATIHSQYLNQSSIPSQTLAVRKLVLRILRVSHRRFRTKKRCQLALMSKLNL